jgi:hypothetical protein
MYESVIPSNIKVTSIVYQIYLTWYCKISLTSIAVVDVFRKVAFMIVQFRIKINIMVYTKHTTIVTQIIHYMDRP